MKAKGVAKDFPVVCVGGSAGGLDAYTGLLRHLPADMGVAIVIVNHLRTVATQLHELLPRYTEMPVELITEGLVIQSNRVFIIPAQRDLHVLGGEFRLKPISKPRGWAGRDHGFSAFPDPILQRHTYRCHCLRLRRRWSSCAVRHKRSGGYYHRAEA
jgi:hypothetical protein